MCMYHLAIAGGMHVHVPPGRLAESGSRRATTYPLTYLPTYLLTYLPTYLLTYLPGRLAESGSRSK